MKDAKDIEVIQARAHDASVSMIDVCKAAGIFPTSFYRSRKNGRMQYGMYRRLLDAVATFEVAK